MTPTNPSYLFTSERLGFRAWQQEDIDAMQEINSDARVMEFFPALLTMEQTKAFIERMNRQFDEKSFCYFAVDVLATKEFIGFIGLFRAALPGRLYSLCRYRLAIEGQRLGPGFCYGRS